MQGFIPYLYLATGGVFLLAFLPQIYALWRDKKGAQSTSLLSWAMYSACSIITLLYAALHTNDVRFMACAGIGVVGNLAVLLIGTCRRIQYAQRRMQNTPAFPIADIFVPYQFHEPVDLPVMAPETLPDRGYTLYH